MAKRIAEASDKDYLEAWEIHKKSFESNAPVNFNETETERINRVNKLEQNHEEWFKYYFSNYATSEPAPFHKASTRRLIKNPEWYEVRAWSRELAKSARSMMEFTYFAMTGRLRNILLVSNSFDNAKRLLLPFKACFEFNERLIHDYGKQESLGSWEAHEFVIQRGCAFRALGWGQSPRGTRKDNIRPDGILIDDIDTDEDCRNEDTMNKKVNWIEQALIATRSISCATLILVNGNVIHNNCAVKRLALKADKFDVVNIRDKNGKSTWKKNTEENIDRVLKMMSYESAQKEYFNNPMDGSDTFKNLKDGKVPNLKQCQLIIYCDPATSNKDVSSASHKAIFLIAQKGHDFFIVNGFLDTMSNSKFIDYLFELHDFCVAKGLENVPVFIENNTLQNPFYEQVLLPMIYTRSNERNSLLPITPDERAKTNKYTRIEGTLEPINRLGHMIFNEKESENKHFERLKAQFENFSPKQKRMDGPDCIEGGVYKLKERTAVAQSGKVEHIPRVNDKRF